MAQKGVVQFRIVPCPNCQDGSSTECGYYGPGSSGHSTTDASLPYDGLCEGWGKLLICYECMQIGNAISLVIIRSNVATVNRSSL